MATLEGVINRLKGSVGNLTFRRTSGRTVVSEKTTDVANKRTSGQQKQRMKWANVIHMYKGIAPLLNYGFENKPPHVSDYNMFTSLNLHQLPVFLTKSEAHGGACVAAPYQISQGSLPSIAVTGEGVNRITDIALGSLVISEKTSVAEFSNAVVQNNLDYHYGDQISFFDVEQRINIATGIPYCLFGASGVVLDKSNNNTLWAVVGKTGFSTSGGHLAHSGIESKGVFCWVHSRKHNGATLVSTQFLLDNNSILPAYTSQEAYYEAASSYGGESDVFLRPDDITRTIDGGSYSDGNTPTPPFGSGSGSSSGGSGSGSGSAGSGSSGNPSGGDDGME